MRTLTAFLGSATTATARTATTTVSVDLRLAQIPPAQKRAQCLTESSLPVTRARFPRCAGGALNGFIGIVEAGFYPAGVLVQPAP